jgi:hypothetical protein
MTDCSNASVNKIWDHTVHPDLVKIRNLVYDSSGFKCSPVILNDEGLEYGATSFKLDDLNLIFRSAKITPLKIGHFVTIWKRIGKNPIQPYDATDPIDLIVISTQNNERFGHFVFPISILMGAGGRTDKNVHFKFLN